MIAQVQVVGHGDNLVTSTIVTTAATGAGHLLVLQIALRSNTPGPTTITSVTDNVLNSYSQAPGSRIVAGTNLDSTEIWYCENAISGTTAITINFSKSTLSITSFEEYSGVKTSSSLDTTNTLAINTAPATGPSLTASVAGELLVSCVENDSFLITGVNPPWTVSYVDPGVFNGFGSGYYINPPLSPQQCPFTPTTNTTAISSGASFLPQPSTTQSRMFQVF